MSGRVTDSDYVKPGEVLPVNYIVLTDENSSTKPVASIQAEYLQRRRMRGYAAQHPDIMNPTVHQTLSRGRDRSASPPSRLGKERVGMSKAFSGYLESLPAKEQEKRERQDVPFPGKVDRKAQLGVLSGPRQPHNYAAKNRDTLRKDILSVSLFPNLYNHKSLLAGM